MSCLQIHDELPALLYGELSPQQAARIEEHLATCPACRAELAACKHTRALLDQVPAPAVDVNAARILQREALRQLGRLRRWRRLAILTTGAAAAIGLLLVGLNLDVRVEAHQVVLRWGSPPTVEAPAIPIAAVAPDVSPPITKSDAASALQTQLVILTQLTQGLADTEARQRKDLGQMQREVTQMQRELAMMRDAVRDAQRQSGRRVSAIERDVSALYAAFFGTTKKGAAE